MNLAFILVAEIPEKLWNSSFNPKSFNAEIYFLATLPPPQTTMNLYLFVLFEITFLNSLRNFKSTLSGTIKGRNNIHNQIESMIKDARESVTLVTSSQELSKKSDNLKFRKNIIQLKKGSYFIKF